jgi:hypothetical protein
MPPRSTTTATRPQVASDVIKVAVQSSRGGGRRVLVVDAPASATVADLKRLLCSTPLCSTGGDALALVLVLKGKMVHSTFLLHMCAV